MHMRLGALSKKKGGAMIVLYKFPYLLGQDVRESTRAMLEEEE